MIVTSAFTEITVVLATFIYFTLFHITDIPGTSRWNLMLWKHQPVLLHQKNRLVFFFCITNPLSPFFIKVQFQMKLEQKYYSCYKYTQCFPTCVLSLSHGNYFNYLNIFQLTLVCSFLSQYFPTIFSLFSLPPPPEGPSKQHFHVFYSHSSSSQQKIPV